jgi:hypothetical protein
LQPASLGCRIASRCAQLSIPRSHACTCDIFYAGAFLLTYEIANLFDQVRDLGTIAWHVLHHTPGSELMTDQLKPPL